MCRRPFRRLKRRVKQVVLLCAIPLAFLLDLNVRLFRLMPLPAFIARSLAVIFWCIQIAGAMQALMATARRPAVAAAAAARLTDSVEVDSRSMKIP